MSNTFDPKTNFMSKSGSPKTQNAKNSLIYSAVYGGSISQELSDPRDSWIGQMISRFSSVYHSPFESSSFPSISRPYSASSSQLPIPRTIIPSCGQDPFTRDLLRNEGRLVVTLSPPIANHVQAANAPSW
jgi:hypothetical protein